MVNLPPQELDRVDNECRALPQEGEPLGVRFPSIVNHEQQHSKNSHNKPMFSDPTCNKVDTGLTRSQSDPGFINDCTIEPFHTHLGRPPG